jgi:hypothetical protein
MLAMSKSWLLATRDVLLQPDATQSLAKMLALNVAVLLFQLFAKSSLEVWHNTNNALSRRPKDAFLMNKLIARKHVVFSSTETNVTLPQRSLAFNTREMLLHSASLKSVKNAFLAKLNSVKSTFAILQLAQKELSFCVMQKRIAKMFKLATK